MIPRAMYTYAWDLIDEGVGTVAGRLRDAGIDTVAMAASYHDGKFLRPHGVSGKVYFPEDGTVYFHTRPERYGAIRPLPNSLLDSHDPLALLAAQAPDLRRSAWVVCTHNTALGRRHPEVVARNAYGDPYWYNLSPAHGAVRDYVVALCADLADRYELASMSLETPGFLPFDHGYHHEFFLVDLSPWAKFLLGLDFSDASVAGARAAGIDAARLRAEARGWLDRYLADDVPPAPDMGAEWWIADLVDDPEWATFLHWRCRLVADLVAEVRAALPRGTELSVLPTVQRPTAASWSEGSSLKLLASAADALEIVAYEPTATRAHADAWDVRRRAGPKTKLNFILRPAHPDLGRGAEAASAVARLRDIGIGGLAFYNYGHFRLRNLAYVRAAVDALGEA